MLKPIILFLVLNFGALALGGLATSGGVQSDWYAGLNKAPWTPPGWVFGAAWTFIMLCFSWYMALLWKRSIDRSFLIWIYGIQLMLNIAWNPLFFSLHWIGTSMSVIGILTALLWFFLVFFAKRMGWYSLLILPYCVWLLIASSLNAYILWTN